jgi:hypothetical protein
MFKTRKIISPLRAGLFSLLLGGAGIAVMVPTVTSCASNQKGGTGDEPAKGAEMKELVINVFGMT